MHDGGFRLAAGLAAAAVILAGVNAARAEHCWLYVDGLNPETDAPYFPGWEYTRAPFTCVRQDDLMSSCSWNAACDDDGDPSDCCATVPDPGAAQTIRLMHLDWHQCFGTVGGTSPPLGRSARWLAFHRQFEFDFDLFREAQFGCGPGQCVDGMCSNEARTCTSDTDCSAHDGCFIEALDWYSGMEFPYGHPGIHDPGVHPDSCGTVAVNGTLETGRVRPAGIACTSCAALPACLFNAGGGPIGGAPTPSTAANCQGFQDFTLSEIPTLDDVARILDASHHGNLHGEVGRPFEAGCSTDADCAALAGPPCDPGNCPGAGCLCPVCSGGACLYNDDVLASDCSPRDPMFWRLHKRLDDTVRAWQSQRPFDLSVVVDRSGSMGETDSSGQTKIQVVTEAMAMLADLLPDAQSSRVGVVSYAGGAGEELGLTPSADAPEALASIAAGLEDSVGGCTSMGAGLEAAAAQLCDGVSPASGKASCHPDASPTLDPGENERKGILLLTDGLENRSPCLNSQGGETLTCGATCGGGQFDYDLLGPHTELCAIGFGQAENVNGNLLTLLAERQGGIYMQSPAKGADDLDGQSGEGNFVDLKDFFVKCFGQISDEFVGIDPKGTMATDEFASDPMAYSTCDDERLTFIAGWNNPAEGAVRLLVNTPSGDLVQADDVGVEASFETKWSFFRVPLPLDGESTGTWRAQLVRPHNRYVNGFTTDALPPSVGIPTVRRQIQRICPSGCDTVLYYEDGHLGSESSYASAVAAEEESGLLTSVTRTADAAEFQNQLASGTWSLIVYAHQMSDQPEPYDGLLAGRLCSTFQNAIVTETRGLGDPESIGSAINRCAGGDPYGTLNYTSVIGDERLLSGTHALTNHGYSVFSYGQEPETLSGGAQAVAVDYFGSTAISALRYATCGQEICSPPAPQEWFMDVLVRGPSELDDAPMRATYRTGESGILASARVLPANVPAGGYDAATVTVTVERPAAGVGQTLLDVGQQPPTSSPDADGFDGRAAALAATTPIPTLTQTYLLNDSGQDGDVHANNAQWTARIPDSDEPESCLVDGMYRLHFKADFTKNGCTTRRELVRSTFIDVGVDPVASGLTVSPTAGGMQVDFCPRDRCGNAAGWGRTVTCGPEPGCSCAPSDITDHGDGCYTVQVQVAPGTGACTIDGAGKPIEVATPNPACVFASGNLTPRDQTELLANLHGGMVAIGNDAHVGGVVVSAGNAALGDRSTIDGDAALGGMLTGDPEGVLGTLTQDADVVLPELVRRTFAVGTGFEEIPNDAAVTMDPGVRGDVVFRARSVVTLNPGVHSFASLNIEPDVVVTTTGAVEIQVEGMLEVGDRAEVHGATPEGLLLYSNGMSLRIGTDVKLTGLVVAPDASISVYSRTEVLGCIGGQHVNFEPQVLVDGTNLQLPATLPEPGGCGDGTVDPGEGCDDGNVQNGDGCDDQCQLEPGTGCTEATAVDLGSDGNNVTTAANACLMVRDDYPVWWGTRGMQLQSTTPGGYSVPFTWTNSCTGAGGSAVFTADWQSYVLSPTSDACATLIDLQGEATGSITLRYFGA